MRLLYCTRPIVATIDNALTVDECDCILNSDISFNPSLGFDYSQNASLVSSYRSSSTAFDFSREFDFLRYRAVELSSKYFEDFTPSTECAEPVQLTRYEIDQQYQKHLDYFNHSGKNAIKNDRCGTVIFYLNEDFSGGETDFPYLNIKIKPKKGMALFFSYHYDLGTNYLTTHAGLPVTNGVKNIATVWLHRLPYDGSQPSLT